MNYAKLDYGRLHYGNIRYALEMTTILALSSVLVLSNAVFSKINDCCCYHCFMVKYARLESMMP